MKPEAVGCSGMGSRQRDWDALSRSRSWEQLDAYASSLASLTSVPAEQHACIQMHCIPGTES
jgi:hypothetical protein